MNKCDPHRWTGPDDQECPTCVAQSELPQIMLEQAAAREKPIADFEEIWLEPDCCADHAGVGRTWCQDQVYDCEHGAEPTKYVRADIAAAEIGELQKVVDAAIEYYVEWIRDPGDFEDSYDAMQAMVAAVADFLKHRSETTK